MSGVGFLARVPKSFLITQLPGVGFSFKTQSMKILTESPGNQSLTIFFTSQTPWPYPMVLDTWLCITFNLTLWKTSREMLFVLFCFFPTTCPVWMHPTLWICMIGSWVGCWYICMLVSLQNTTRLFSFSKDLKLCFLKRDFQQFSL